MTGMILDEHRTVQKIFGSAAEPLNILPQPLEGRRSYAM